MIVRAGVALAMTLALAGCRSDLVEMKLGGPVYGSAAEAQAQERGYDIEVGRFPFQANGKALGLGDYAGWVKIITDKQYGEILGASMIGPEVTELLPELTLAQMMELTPAEIGRNVHAHPTLSEVLMEAAHAAEGHAIHI